jgi:hypothetical protein
MKPALAVERCWSPREVADRLGLSVDSVRRTFRTVDGVLLVGDGDRRALRIPESVLVAWLERRRVKGGGR